MLAAFLPQHELLSQVGELHRIAHQKYPSRFFFSIDPDSS